MNPSVVVLVAILTFAGGIILGYVEGWNRGSQQGYHVGWVEANTELRRLLARAKSTGDERGR